MVLTDGSGRADDDAPGDDDVVVMLNKSIQNNY
jgi:hypothetical protein